MPARRQPPSAAGRRPATPRRAPSGASAHSTGGGERMTGDGPPRGDRVLHRLPLPARAVWIAHELLTTFEAELEEAALVPGSGGVLEVRLDGERVWSRAG